MTTTSLDPVVQAHLQAVRAALRARNVRVAVDHELVCARARDAMRAAKFEETSPELWKRVLRTIPEGMSTTRANELFMWARQMLINREQQKGCSEAEAKRRAARSMLTQDAD
jgi:hypothetical protein